MMSLKSILSRRFTFYQQLEAMDCGPTCLRMVAKYYGRDVNLETLKNLAGQTRQGVSMLGLSEAAERIGFRTRGAHLTYAELSQHAIMPCILHWEQNHYAVAISFQGNKTVRIADPARGVLSISKKEFLEHWISTHYESDAEPVGSVLLLDPTLKFYERENEPVGRLGWRWLLRYIRKNTLELVQVFVLLFVTSLLQLIFPFLTQSVVDTGIDGKNLSFVTLILIAQLILVLSTNVADFIRNRLLLQVSSMLNISILSDFWIKLTHLPISYFTLGQAGDTLQRIGDHKNIQQFLTGSAISTFFSTFNFVLYACILALYNIQICIIFFIGAAIYFLWVQVFLKTLRTINYQNFYLSSKENNATFQLIQGMPEIKLNNAEHLKRWEWEGIQARIFKLGFKTLSITQLQQVGATLINQGKDVVITFVVARLVIEGQLTLGAMLAIQYVVGHLSSPVEQLIIFIQKGQEAKISLERLNQVHQLPNEEADELTPVTTLSGDKSIYMDNLNFTYPGAHDPVLHQINLSIPQGKVTAIVGASGSGKTTLLKLLLKFYLTHDGAIRIGETDLKQISAAYWRRNCGAVLQEGFIFNDTIARNIAVGDETPDEDKLRQACRIANILQMVDELPNGLNTQLGSDGQGISQGQRQRVLIARAVYKDPLFLFFDEATNALDANNEKDIVQNLEKFFSGRTVVIVAHRLSTVRQADKIVVLEQGRIVEEGNHDTLSKKKGRYYELVRNQLELGEA